MHRLLCWLRCSGSDAINLTDRSSALLMGCTVEARKTGVKAFDKASGQINGCHIRECKELGVLVQNEAKLQLQRSAPQVVILLPSPDTCRSSNISLGAYSICE